MLSLIKSILKSVELYLILKNKLFFFELTSGHEKKSKNMLQNKFNAVKKTGQTYNKTNKPTTGKQQ